MEERIIELFTGVKGGFLTPKEATDKLCAIVIQTVPKECMDDEFRKSSVQIEKEWGYSGLTDTMYEEYARECFRVYFQRISGLL